jgi:hypothetical protein
MALEHYVSAEWGPVDTLTNNSSIAAVDNDGTTWWIPSLDCDVPPWPQYLKDNPDELTRLTAEALAREVAKEGGS